MTDDESTLDGYRQRSQLLAELGRYDEAAEELGFALALAPADPSALTLLARLHLAAGRPGAAIAAADAAIGGPPHPPEAPTAFAPPAPSGSPTSSAPSEPPGSSGAPRPVGSAAPSEPPGSPEGPQPVGPPGPPSSRPGPPVGSGPPGEAPAVVPTAALVIRAIALADLGEYAESARTADRILAAGPTDAYAQRSAAAILAEARNGQPALDAAWRGVELAPDEPQAHLVLALVAGRLELFDLAERAYREALRLDPELAGARDDPGCSGWNGVVGCWRWNRSPRWRRCTRPGRRRCRCGPGCGGSS